ncbi:MAG: hypothetical protein Q9216_006532, partial [Gyalolechia sp. 2 TL-2023]
AFAAAIKHNFPSHLRLSIHQSTGEHKISLSLLPTKTSYTTPWMCAIAYAADGTLTSGPKGDFEADGKFQLVRQNARPSYFVEKDHQSTTTTTATGALVGHVPASELHEADDSNGGGGSGDILANGKLGGGARDREKIKGSSGACSFCGKSTHTAERCFDKYPHLAPRWVREKIVGSATAAVTERTADP